eukprot:gnl/TRDRNA2_/TRDRNA2_136797_c1_seq1.p1 gnl/TRDRNA2_/TRDRNA2_136797_c1~~gnl/TRDRNA2_/TRDRNA2_136797_c1_seq1.p1  ORF type:complete len:107 (+),score=12.97 gnl/TRDRNA2_/TRDRNA2_136797_c1_seq1:182-502(+)
MHRFWCKQRGLIDENKHIALNCTMCAGEASYGYAVVHFEMSDADMCDTTLPAHVFKQSHSRCLCPLLCSWLEKKADEGHTDSSDMDAAGEARRTPSNKSLGAASVT